MAALKTTVRRARGRLDVAVCVVVFVTLVFVTLVVIALVVIALVVAIVDRVRHARVVGEWRGS